jgi:hypothetical protein
MGIFELILKWLDDIKESYIGDKWIEGVKQRRKIKSKKSCMKRVMGW